MPVLFGMVLAERDSSTLIEWTVDLIAEYSIGKRKDVNIAIGSSIFGSFRNRINFYDTYSAFL